MLPIYAIHIGAGIEVRPVSYAAAQLVFRHGRLSDRAGEPVILVSLLGTMLSCLLLASAQTLLVIYASRILAGFFAASIGTAQAIVTDVTPVEKRAQAMGLIGAAFGLSFVLGPALGGALSEVHLLAPFYGIVVLASINLVLAIVWLPESRPPESRVRDWSGLATKLVPSPIRLIFAHHDRRIGLYLYLFFHLFAAFAALEAQFTLFLHRRFALSALDAGYIFAVLGVSIALTQGVLIRRLAPILGEAKLVPLGLVVMGAGLATIPFVPSVGWLYLVGPVIAVGNGLAFPSFTSLYSQACLSEKAGELMGESQSMATTGRIIGPLWAGWTLDHIGLASPFVIAGVMMFIGLGLFMLWRHILLDETKSS